MRIALKYPFAFCPLYHRWQRRRLARKASSSLRQGCDKSQVLIALSHEIRTPMNAIVGFSRLLGDTALDAKQHEYCSAIRQSSEDLMLIFNDMLTNSRIKPSPFASQPPPSAGAPEQQEFSADLLKNLRILLVEDTYFNQLLAVELLKSKIENVWIEVAENGQQAMEKIAVQRYHLVLMDVKMPVMDGLEATRRIRSQTDALVRSLPVIGLTANAVPSELDKCLLAGMDRWVTKPIDVEELLRTIKEVLASRKTG